MKNTLTYFTVFIYLFLLFASAYLLQNSSDFTDMIAPVTGCAALVSLTAALVLWVINIIKAVMGYRRGENVDIKIIRNFKLVQIPFFILNFLMWCICFIVTMFNPMIMIFFIVLPLGIAWTFCVMMSTSIHSVIYIHRNRVANNKLHKVLQFIFGFDIADTIYLCRK